jgi:hypothetical protein
MLNIHIFFNPNDFFFLFQYVFNVHRLKHREKHELKLLRQRVNRRHLEHSERPRKLLAIRQLLYNLDIFRYISFHFTFNTNCAVSFICHFFLSFNSIQKNADTQYNLGWEEFNDYFPSAYRFLNILYEEKGIKYSFARHYHWHDNDICWNDWQHLNN